MPKPTMRAWSLVFIGIFAVAWTADAPFVQAESPLQFLTRQHRERVIQPRPHRPVYTSQPVHIERRGQTFFQDLFEFGEIQQRPRASTRTAAAPARNMQRVVCRRECDGAQLVLGIVPAQRVHREVEQMCTAAGGSAATRLVVERFVPGEGFASPVQLASAQPLMEGRASLNTSVAPRAAARTGAGECPKEGHRAFMTVPILHDATLRHGDVVATRDGFRVFVGRGRPPFKESDFVDTAKRKVAADIRKLQIADR